jgi:hypothetical protein
MGDSRKPQPPSLHPDISQDRTADLLRYADYSVGILLLPETFAARCHWETVAVPATLPLTEKSVEPLSA